MIDLRKVDLLPQLFCLDYTIVFPEGLLNREVYGLTSSAIEQMLNKCLQVHQLDVEGVNQASKYHDCYPKLSLIECGALCIVEKLEEAILLTGDECLRKTTEQKTIEVHGDPDFGGLKIKTLIHQWVIQDRRHYIRNSVGTT